MKQLKFSLAVAAIVLSVVGAMSASKAASHRAPFYGQIAIVGVNTQLKGEIVGGVHRVADLSTKVQDIDYTCDNSAVRCSVNVTATPTEIGTSNVWQILTSQTTVHSTGLFTANF